MKLIREIAFGGYGEVSEVELADGTRVAQKKFAPQGKLTSADREKLRKRFVREVATQQLLTKYGTLAILDSDLKADPPWFTMPLADRNYREQIAEDRAASKLSPEPLADILNCLGEVHQRGFVHRDLKPENILRVDGRWYLADLGLAIGLDLSATTKLTTTGAAYGSPLYMAPEQARDFSRVTAAADMFSFGCILHDLVDGGARSPFTTATTKNKSWDQVIRKCTALDPAKRFASIKALRGVVIQTLRKHANLQQSPETVTWARELESLGSWEPEKFLEFASAVRSEDAGTERGVVAELTAEHLAIIKEKHLEAWFQIGHAYATWMAAGFTWAFCDVIADRAATFVDDTDDLELMAEVLVGLAQLGHKNHRWYVMKMFVRRCGKELDEFAAQRIQFEFQANDLQHLIHESVAELFKYSLEDYHPLIASLAYPEEPEEPDKAREAEVHED